MYSQFKKILSDPLKGELIKESSASLVFRVFGIAFSYIFTLLITRNLGAEAMGIFALCLTVLNIVTVFAKLGFDNASIKFAAELNSLNDQEKIKATFSKIITLAFFSGLVLSIFLYFISDKIAIELFGKPHMAQYLKFTAVAIIPMSLLHIISENFRGLKKIKSYTFFRYASVYLFGTVLILSGIYFTSEPFLPVYSFTGGVLISFLLALFFWNRIMPVNLFNQHKADIKRIFQISFPMLITGSITLLMVWTDTFILGIYETEENIGIYNVAVRVSNIAALALFSVNAIAAPKIAEAFGKNEKTELYKTIQHAAKLVFYTSTPVIIFLLVFPDYILSFFGNEFHAGTKALIFLTIGQAINAYSGSVGYILQMTDKQKVFQNIIAFALVINIILNIILIPEYGINGAAISSMICMVFWNIASAIYIKKKIGVNSFYVPKLF